MPLIDESWASERSFEVFNRIFCNGVPADIAAAVDESRLDSRDPGQLYGMDMDLFGASMVAHFEQDWLGIGGDPWFGPEAGELVYRTIVRAIQSAGQRRIKALWVESDSVRAQVVEDQQLVLVLIGSPRP
ncbi:MAG: hypothetical protein CME59_14110 [Halioglobus sp.]|nr:hypothetical protein [Halioglobus sp.]